MTGRTIALSASYATGILGAFACLFSTAPVWASEVSETVTKSVSVSGEQALAMAEQLVTSGNTEEARKILETLAKAKDGKFDAAQVTFLLGMVEVAEGNYKAAEEMFRRLLDDNPKLIRVRLELARALFEQKRDVAAAYHFRLVLGNGLPENTIKQVRHFLRSIEQRKKYSVRVGASLMPNSNVNAGPKGDTVTVFGLPFQLDDEAQKKSGLGLSTTLQVAAFPKIRKNLRLEARATVRAADYSNKKYDDIFTAVEAGPRFISKNFTASLLATASKRFFAGNEYSSSYGGRLVMSSSLSKRLRLTFRGSVAEVDYPSNNSRSGPVYSIGASLARIIDKRTQGGLGLQITTEDTQADQLKNNQYRLHAFFKRELPAGITVNVSPEYIFRDFKHSGREDETASIRLELTKRNWRYYGFAPVFSYTYLTNNSNNPFFDYDRHSADMGLTRAF